MTYKVALSSMTLTGKIPPGDPLWHTFNGSFRNVELDTYQLGESVYEGRPLTTPTAARATRTATDARR